MGLMIDGGPSELDRIYASARQQRDRARPSKNFIGFYGWTGILMVGTMAALFCLKTWSDAAHDVKQAEFTRLVVSSCFTTQIGANGVAVGVDVTKAEVTMIFKSGIRETYQREDLETVSCEHDVRGNE